MMARSERKNTGFMGIVKGLIPQKGDSPGEIIRKIVFLVSLVVLTVMVVLIINNAVQAKQDIDTNSSIADIFHSSGIQIDTQKREELEKQYPKVQERFLPLLEKNEDTVGWITISDSEGNSFVDHPVVQCDDNDYYLKHDFNGNYSRAGSIYVDYHDPLTAESRLANIVLYGHNMLDTRMFSRLTEYFSYTHKDRNDLSFYKEHPTITFSTLYDTSTYKIFAGILTNADSKAGKVFNYHLVHNFASKSEFEAYCGEILDRTAFYTPDVDLQYGDELLTLSTCIYGFNDAADTRWVIFARKVREGESETVDVEKAFVNPDPKFYDMYYDVYGGKWGGRKWDPVLIKGYEGKND